MRQNNVVTNSSVAETLDDSRSYDLNDVIEIRIY